MRAKEDSRVFLPLLLSVMILAAIFIAVYFYNSMPEEGSLDQGLAEFYERDFYNLLDYQKDHSCLIKMSVWTKNNSILISSNCTSEYPYSAFEAFMSVARGEIGSGDNIYYTNADWEMDEREVVETRLNSLLYPLGQECSLPCLDGKLPDGIDVIDVRYDPPAGQASELFKDYSLDNFENLTFRSYYSYILHYSGSGNVLEWKYLIGESDQGSFILDLNIDRPILNIKNERLTEEQGDDQYVFNETSESRFVGRGVSVGADKLVVEW